MKTKTAIYQQFTFGFIFCEKTANIIANQLRFVTCEKNDFTWKIENNCTIFQPPRNLGVERHNRATYYVKGVRDALMLI